MESRTRVVRASGRFQAPQVRWEWSCGRNHNAKEIWSISGLYNVDQRMDMSMRRFKERATSMLLVSLVVPLHSQQSSAWKDPSPHTTRFVTVDKDVRLE